MTDTTNEYQRMIGLSRYAKWLEEENRRETWEETVQRYSYNVLQKYDNIVDRKELTEAITNLDVVVCSVFCEALLLFLATLKLIVQLCTQSVVIIAIIAVEIARIISTH